MMRHFYLLRKQLIQAVWKRTELSFDSCSYAFVKLLWACEYDLYQALFKLNNCFSEKKRSSKNGAATNPKFQLFAAL
jgi:hypothetical protein